MLYGAAPRRVGQRHGRWGAPVFVKTLRGELASCRVEVGAHARNHFIDRVGCLHNEEVRWVRAAIRRLCERVSCAMTVSAGLGDGGAGCGLGKHTRSGRTECGAAP
jgi:hypothetical protein